MDLFVYLLDLFAYLLDVWLVDWFVVFLNLSGSCNIFYLIGKSCLLAVGVQGHTLSSLIALQLRRSEKQSQVSLGELLSKGNMEMFRIF